MAEGPVDRTCCFNLDIAARHLHPVCMANFLRSRKFGIDGIRRNGLTVLIDVLLANCPSNVYDRRSFEENGKDKLKCVELLLEAGVDTNLKERRYKYVRHLDDYGPVERYRHTSSADEHSSNCDASRSPLECSLEETVHRKVNIDIVKLLISSGADVNFVSHDGERALSMISGRQYEHIDKDGYLSEILIEAGARCQLSPGFSELMTAIECKQIDKISVLLNSNSVDINFQNDFSETPLRSAVANNLLETVHTLLELGANTNILDGNSETPLEVALKNGFTDIATILVDAGSDVNMVSVKNESTLHLALQKWAIENPETRLIDSLINKGVCINGIDGQEARPIFIGLLTMNPSVVSCLIKNGASVNVATSDGDTLLHFLAKIWFPYSQGGYNLSRLLPWFSTDDMCRINLVKIARLLLDTDICINTVSSEHGSTVLEFFLLMTWLRKENLGLSDFVCGMRNRVYQSQVLDITDFHHTEITMMQLFVAAGGILRFSFQGGLVIARTLAGHSLELLSFIEELPFDDMLLSIKKPSCVADMQSMQSDYSLMNICRHQIRYRILSCTYNKSLFHSVKCLPIPLPLQKYLLLDVPENDEITNQIP